MALSKEKTNEIAMQLLQAQMEKEGLRLRPSEVKREMSNLSKRLGISKEEAAEFAKIITEQIYTKTVNEFNKIITGKVEN